MTGLDATEPIARPLTARRRRPSRLLTSIHPAADRGDPVRAPVHRALLLDVDQRVKSTRGDPGPADADPGDLCLAELRRRGQLHPILPVRAELFDHHARHHDRLHPLQYADRLRVLTHRVAGAGQGVLPLPGHDLPALPGDPRRTVRHLRQAAVVRDPGLGLMGQHVPAADRAGVLREPVLHLPHAPVHARDPDASCPMPPGWTGQASSRPSGRSSCR